jgi:hypothetical protein
MRIKPRTTTVMMMTTTTTTPAAAATVAIAMPIAVTTCADWAPKTKHAPLCLRLALFNAELQRGKRSYFHQFPDATKLPVDDARAVFFAQGDGRDLDGGEPDVRCRPAAGCGEVQ